MFALVAVAASACDKSPAQPAAQPTSAPTPSSMPATADHAGHAQAPVAASDAGGRDAGLAGYASVEVDPSRQQLLGIKTAAVSRQAIASDIRTVGTVQADETRTSHVHVKFDGVIEAIYVDYTGRAVRKGQPLFKIFSRELLAAQQEYLSSLAAVSRVPPGAGDAVGGVAQQLATASRERLRLFDVPASVLRDIERTGVAQRAVTILSPQTGTVVAKEAVAGLAVTPMMHLYLITDLSRVWVLADIYERDLAQIKVGQAAKLRIEAIPGRTFAGTATFVSPSVDQATRTMKVRFEFPNRDGSLRPGMYATVEIATGAGEGLVIPADSVIDTGERKIVFVARGNGRFDPRAIVTGAAFGSSYEVIEGLKAGEVIATSGQFLLDSESRIRGTRAPGGPNHGGH